jgi:hypothetical protein
MPRLAFGSPLLHLPNRLLLPSQTVQGLPMAVIQPSKPRFSLLPRLHNPGHLSLTFLKLPEFEFELVAVLGLELGQLAD